ncbi:MAG: GGDEF domain-containing protein [Clostridiaceae bacterium]
MKNNLRKKISIVLLSIVIFTIFLVFSFPKLHTLSGMFNIIPIIFISWLYGTKMGVITGILAFPYVMIIYTNISDIKISLLFTYQGLIIVFSEMILGYVIGHISCLLKKLKIEIKQRKEIEDKLNYYANKDSLTNIFNRRSGLYQLKEQINYVKENPKLLLSISYIDINSLKKVNDVYGHNEGDILIKNVTNIINKNISNTDILVRLGGDEFLLIMPNNDYKKALETIKNIKNSLELYNKSKIKTYINSISSGVVEFTPDLDLESYVNLADNEMYKEKSKYYVLMEDTNEKCAKL